MLGDHPAEMPVLVEVDGETLPASELHSYRGFYEQLAIGFGQAWPRSPVYATVGELRAALQGAIGRTFEGWKGGDFTMSGDTTLWIAPEGTVDPSGQPGEIVVRDGVAVVRAFGID